MLVISIRESKQRLEEKFRPNVVKAILRDSLRNVAMKVHRELMPGHFGREAYVKYRHIWPLNKQKKPHRGGALFITGTLQRNIMQRAMARAIQGQVNVRLIMPMGRPAIYTGKSLENQIKMLMIRSNTSYKNAEAALLSIAGYGEEKRRDFEKKITYLTKGDRKLVADWLRDEVTDQMNNRTKGGRRIKR